MIPDFFEAWRPLSVRIRAFRSAVELHATFSISHNMNPYGVDKDTRRQITDIVARVFNFRDNYRPFLSPDALSAFELFENGGAKQNKENTGGDELLNRAVLIKLFAFEAEISHLIFDSNVQNRFNCERAFIHLQRTIVVDAEFRQKWESAFQAGEEQCEKLGSVHLLLFGIWAFKLNASGARTDLVFSDREVDSDKHPGSVLVLTEWKKATNDGATAFNSARRQVEKYASGILGGNELAAYRYCVVVSQDFINVPDDVVISNIVYRHINIAVNPSTPSVKARNKVQSP